MAGRAARAPEKTRERCRRCDAPDTVDLYAGYWLCRPYCDRLGREAMKLSKG